MTEQERTQAAQRGGSVSAWLENFSQKHGWSGSTLKMIAIVTMLIDHTGAGIIENYIYSNPQRYSTTLYTINEVMRGIGRIAFPIFCFLLVEGFTHTRNVWKYLLRLLIFGVIAEIPFNLGIFRSVRYADYQNVFWTLALGVLMMILTEKAAKFNVFKKAAWLNTIATVVFDIFIFIMLGAVALAAKTDYNMLGLGLILFLYAFRGRRLEQAIWCALYCWLFLDEIPAMISVIPMLLYNGKRGWKLKYFFYAFYPAHLLIIWAVGFLFGL